jgi:hypothetical protein
MGMDRILQWAILCLVMSASLQACTSAPIGKDPEPSPGSTTDPMGVTLVLMATRPSTGCCRVFTMNPGEADATVICTLMALDPSGRLVYSGFVVSSPPGRRRPISAFKAPPGREGHGVFQLPIDLAHDSYTAPCRPAAWHGGSPL